jgi:cytoskeletal protein CcmA (bactofilin family)
MRIFMAVEVNDQPEFVKAGSKLSETPPKADARAKSESQNSPSPEIDRIPNGWVQERTRVAVGQGVNVSGKLIFNEPVRIEGTFRGEVTSSSLVVIAETGTVEGRMRATRLVVLGELRGDIVDANRAYLGGHARVYGDIFADNLTVCEGAYFSGNVKMTANRHHASPAA